jgi:hypothetical protein
MKSPTRRWRRRGWLLAGIAVVISAVGGSGAGTAGAQAGDPVLVTVNSPQVTEPGSQVTFTFTISDAPPCGASEFTTLDSADFVLTDPSGLSTIAGFATNQPAGTVSGVLSPDETMLSLLFDSAFPCSNGSTAPVVIDVTIDVPAGVPLGTQLTLDASFRGFATSTNQDYVVERQGIALIAEPAPPSPPDGGNGSPGGGPGGGGPSTGSPSVGNPSGAGAVAGVGQPVTVAGLSQPVAAATPVRATGRFTG